MLAKSVYLASCVFLFSCSSSQQRPAAPSPVVVQSPSAELDLTEHEIAAQQAASVQQAPAPPDTPTSATVESEPIANTPVSSAPPANDPVAPPPPPAISQEAKSFLKTWDETLGHLFDARNCAKSTGANNMLFNKKCVPLTKGKQILVRVKKIRQAYNGIVIESENKLPSGNNKKPLTVATQCVIPLPKKKSKRKKLIGKLMKIVGREAILLKAGKTTRIDQSPILQKFSIDFEPCTFIKTIPTPDGVYPLWDIAP